MRSLFIVFIEGLIVEYFEKFFLRGILMVFGSVFFMLFLSSVLLLVIRMMGMFYFLSR